MILPISVSIVKKFDALFLSAFSLLFRADRRCYLFLLLSSHKLPAFSSEIVKSLLICFDFLSFLSNQAAARTTA
ncbi:hypothetical protein EGW74_11690 [Enterococcus casseliflavus]|nr:hypothetical protein EGW74_11690 [Enterococcus casseliflavus]